MSDSDSAASSTPANTKPGGGDPTAIIDEELLIAEVKKYPILYATLHAEYVERQIKKNNWIKICRSLCKQWSNFSPKKKRETITHVQMKWKRRTEMFFKSCNTSKKHSTLKKSLSESLSFLLPPAAAADNVGVGPIPDHVAVGSFPEALHLEPLPSSSQVGEFFPTNLEPTLPDTPNKHFALMLVPLLDRLSHEELYITWKTILDTIQKAEGEKRLEVRPPEMLFPTASEFPSALQTTFDTQVEMEAEAQAESEEKAVKKPKYPSHGRPTNSEGEIIYPETDHEDLDEI